MGEGHHPLHLLRLLLVVLLEPVDLAHELACVVLLDLLEVVHALEADLAELEAVEVDVAGREERLGGEGFGQWVVWAVLVVAQGYEERGF